MPFSAEYRDLATPRVKAILDGLTPAKRRAMLTRLGKGLERLLKAHFRKREQDSPNKQGFPRSHFWNREVRDKTAFREATPDKATVGIDSAPFRMKLTGGTIRPGPGRKLLAIPLRAEAYGALPRAGTIAGLFFHKTKQGKMFLATADPSDNRFFRFYWRLVPFVTIPADPRALPPAAEMKAAIEQLAEKEIERITAQKK